MAPKTQETYQRKSTINLNIPLKSRKEIYSVFIIPTIISCFIYIVHFSADLLVALQHVKETNYVWACITLCLMYIPAIAYFILIVTRPGWWMTDDDKKHKGAFLWFLLQICKLIIFPLFALCRYARLIVLAIEAIRSSEEERKKILSVVEAPAAIELYFFLQAWFQAAPQAVFQTHLLFDTKLSSRSYESEAIQGLCIIMSVCIMALRTTSFQRYESQRIVGRKVPWAMWLKKYKIQELENLEEKQLLRLTASPSDTDTANGNQCEIESKNEDNLESQKHLRRQNSTTPPLPPKNVKIVPPPTPLRGITSITPLTVPDAVAPAEPPKDDSIVDNFKKAEEDIEPSTENVQNNQAFEKSSIVISNQKNLAKGLENDDSKGTFLSFVWWFLFILPRILSIVIFYEFYPKILLSVLVLHYICMISYLFYYAKYNDVTTFFINLWLGFVYMFSIIEYRIKFKYADKWLVFYYTFVILQNIFMTMTWYLYGNWDGLWYSYSFNIIFICMSLCILSTILYHLWLKPKKRKVYIT